MKNLIQAFLIIYLMVECSAPDHIYRIEPGLQTHWDEVVAIASQYGHNIPKDNLILKLTPNLAAKIKAIGETTLHYENNQLGQRTIQLDSAYWMNSNESKRQTLILHEFGHAYLGRQHTTAYSLMDPGMYGWPICASGEGPVECDHKFLLRELFGNINQ